LAHYRYCARGSRRTSGSRPGVCPRRPVETIIGAADDEFAELSLGSGALASRIEEWRAEWL
jgi:hypothetical protein